MKVLTWSAGMGLPSKATGSRLAQAQSIKLLAAVSALVDNLFQPTANILFSAARQIEYNKSDADERLEQALENAERES